MSRRVGSRRVPQDFGNSESGDSSDYTYVAQQQEEPQRQLYVGGADELRRSISPRQTVRPVVGTSYVSRDPWSSETSEPEGPAVRVSRRSIGGEGPSTRSDSELERSFQPSKPVISKSSEEGWREPPEDGLSQTCLWIFVALLSALIFGLLLAPLLRPAQPISHSTNTTNTTNTTIWSEIITARVMEKLRADGLTPSHADVVREINKEIAAAEAKIVNQVKVVAAGAIDEQKREAVAERERLATIEATVKELQKQLAHERRKSPSKTELEQAKTDVINVVNKTITGHAHDIKDRVDRLEHRVDELGGNHEAVGNLVEGQLRIFNADKTAKADYALASSGARVIQSSAPAHGPKGEHSALGAVLFNGPFTKEPNVILSADMSVGNCHPLAMVTGEPAYVVIELYKPIVPTGFTYEHIDQALAPSNLARGATPKHFAVRGLTIENLEARHKPNAITALFNRWFHPERKEPTWAEKNGMSLGNMTFNAKGNPLQSIELKSEGHPFKYILVQVDTTQQIGIDYTCLYRVRIHGTPLDQ